MNFIEQLEDYLLTDTELNGQIQHLYQHNSFIFTRDTYTRDKTNTELCNRLDYVKGVQHFIAFLQGEKSPDFKSFNLRFISETGRYITKLDASEKDWLEFGKKVIYEQPSIDSKPYIFLNLLQQLPEEYALSLFRQGYNYQTWFWGQHEEPRQYDSAQDLRSPLAFISQFAHRPEFRSIVQEHMSKSIHFSLLDQPDLLKESIFEHIKDKTLARELVFDILGEKINQDIFEPASHITCLKINMLDMIDDSQTPPFGKIVKQVSGGRAVRNQIESLVFELNEQTILPFNSVFFHYNKNSQYTIIFDCKEEFPYCWAKTLFQTYLVHNQADFSFEQFLLTFKLDMQLDLKNAKTARSKI